jgi:molybdopterin biosynthesis enzyme
VWGGVLYCQAGDRLGPGEVGLLAGAGAATVSVYGAPTVAVLSSGDELVSPDCGAALGAHPAPHSVMSQHQLHRTVSDNIA